MARRTEPRPLRYRGRLNRRGRNARKMGVSLSWRSPIVFATETRVEVVGDAGTCPSCAARAGILIKPGGDIDNRDCTNENGCRCVGVMTLKDPNYAVDVRIGPVVRGSGPIFVLAEARGGAAR